MRSFFLDTAHSYDGAEKHVRCAGKWDVDRTGSALHNQSEAVEALHIMGEWRAPRLFQIGEDCVEWDYRRAQGEMMTAFLHLHANHRSTDRLNQTLVADYRIEIIIFRCQTRRLHRGQLWAMIAVFLAKIFSSSGCSTHLCNDKVCRAF